MVRLLVMAVVVTGTLSGCQINGRLKRYEIQYFDVFDTVTSVIAYAESEEEFSGQAAQIYAELKRYHELYDIYNEYEGINNIKTINDKAGMEAVRADERIMELLLFSKVMYEATEGRINVAYGSVLKLWHTYRTEGLENPENAAIPTKEELNRAAAYTDIDRVILDEAASSVYLADKEMSLDVGAVGKGYAAQKAAEAARAAGMTSFLISVGGNVVVEGVRADGTPWQVGIQNPDTEAKEAYIAKIALHSGEALVTSGNYQRFYIVDGKRYHHIINPDTNMPAEYFASVSVLAKDSGVADALSTALYNMPLTEGMALVEALEDTEAMWILEDGEQICTDGFLNSRL